MGWIKCVCCEKLQRDFVALTFVWIEPVQYVLQQVSCSYETISNGPKYYETDRNISFGSHGVDWVGSLRKIPMWLCGTNFCINCTCSPRFAPSFMQLRNDPKWPKYYEMNQNLSLGFNGVDQVRWLRKITTRLRGTNFCINCTSSTRFAPSWQMHANTTKTSQNMSLGSNGVDHVRLLPKI